MQTAPIRDDARDFLGVIALELADAQPAHAALRQTDAATLAQLLGHDLQLLDDAAGTLDLVLAAAHFDPAEVLRGGWPLHRRLQALHARAPGDKTHARLIALGADATGDIPQPLQCDASLQGGRLRVLPFLLSGEGATTVAERLEDVLLDRGMARAETALFAQEHFGARIEHARYLSVHDLAAMMSMQYAHMGLEPLWPLIETALFAPDGDAWLDAPPEPLVHYRAGEAHIALFTPDAWEAHYIGRDTGIDAEKLERQFGYFEARQRQIASVLQAHGIDVTFDCCAGRDDPRQALA